MEKKIEICSNALLLLGHKPISSFDEPGAGALLAKNLWETTYRNFLSINTWKFAKKYANLNRVVTPPLNPQFQYQFQIPSDYIRIQGTNPNIDYEIYEDKILANTTTLDLEYYAVIREELLPPYAVKVLELSMASVLAVPLTVDATRAEYYAKLSQQQLITAMSIDSSSQPAKGFMDTPLTTVRY